MTVELYARRKRTLDTYYSGLLTKKALIRIADDFDSSYDAVRIDWSRREQWEPFIWMMEESRQDAQKLLYSLQLGREQAIKLMKIADPKDSAKVGAIGKLTDVVTKEIELRQSLGLLPKMAEKLDIREKIEQVNIDATDDEDTILSKAAAILDKKLRKQREPTEVHTGVGV
jgi:hypothetical protein